MKLLLLNGPPGCGKDFVGNMLEADAPDMLTLAKFAKVLKESTHGLYNLTYPNGVVYPWDYYEDCKDEPNDDFLGLTPRQAYINVSETYFKPVHGKDVFGKMLLKQIKAEDEPDLLWIVTDSGFREEADVLIEHFGADNCMLLHVHREGHTFDGDSRSYISVPHIGMDYLENPGEPQGLWSNLTKVLPWLNPTD